MRIIPNFPDVTESETATERGARALRWILQTGVTVTVADVDLERADVAAGYAVGVASAEDIRRRISHVRHAILAELRIRRAFAKADVAQPSCKVERPNVGPMAPLRPAPIVRPPAPMEVDIAF